MTFDNITHCSNCGEKLVVLINEPSNISNFSVKDLMCPKFQKYGDSVKSEFSKLDDINAIDRCIDDVIYRIFMNRIYIFRKLARGFNQINGKFAKLAELNNVDFMNKIKMLQIFE